MRLLFLSFILLFAGCKVGTNSTANIPPKKEEKVVQDSKRWSQILKGFEFESSSDKKFKAFRVVVEDDNRVLAGVKGEVLFGDDDRLFFSKLIKRGKFDVNSSISFSFRDLNLSERVVILGAKVDNKIVELWLDKNSITPTGEYIDDITVDNQLYSIYKIGDLLVLDKDKSTKDYKIIWRELIDKLIQKELLGGVDFVEDIYFGFKMVRGDELFVVDEFNISK
jgi:hypothetical protein